MRPTKTLSTLFALACLVVSGPSWSKKPIDTPTDDNPIVSAKVTVCHKNHHTISIAASALPAHEAHGDFAIDEENPSCPAEDADDGAQGTACVGDSVEDTVTQDDIDLLATLDGPRFDTANGLVYLPQVRIDILGNVLTFAVILQRVNDMDFLVRHVEALAEPADDVIYVEFDGTRTVAPFDVVVMSQSAESGVITGVEFCVLEGCAPVQLTGTNFSLAEEGTDP